MANLTITTDEETLQRARLRALEQGTSVNALLREYLETYAGGRSAREAAVAALLDLSRRTESRRGGRTWTRNELHER